MSIEVFPQKASGYDPTKYEPYSFISNVSDLSNSYLNLTEVINITGKGYLSNFAVHKPAASTSYIKVTIDGEIIFWGGQNNSNTTGIFGVVNTNNLIGETGVFIFSTGALSLVLGNYFRTFSSEYNYGGGSNVLIIDNNIYFENSIKIEIGSSITNGHNYIFSGGLYNE